MNLIDTFNHLDWTQVLNLTGQHIMLVGVAVGLAILVDHLFRISLRDLGKMLVQPFGF